MNGWWKFYRAMFEHAVWALAPGQFKVWVTILGMANPRPTSWWDGKERVEIPAGAFVSSQDHLAKAAKVSRKVVRRALENLERIGSIRAKVRANRWTLVEVVNWHVYQAEWVEEGQEEGQPRANRGPQLEKKRSRDGRRRQESGGSPGRPRTPASSGCAGPLSPKPLKGPWLEENMTFDELRMLFVSVPASGFAQLYVDLLARDYKPDVLDGAVKAAVPGWPLEPEDGASAAGGRVAFSGSPSGGSSETVAVPPVELLVEGLLALEPEEQRATAGLLVKWGLPPATVMEALWLAQEITTVDPEMDRQAARAIEKHGDAHCRAAITETVQEAKAWLADAAQMREHDPHLWDRLRRQEATRDGRGGRP